MSVEFGVFNSEGCVERGLWSEEEAQKAMANLIADGEEPDEVSVGELCPDHEEQPLDGCEECAAEEEESE